MFGRLACRAGWAARGGAAIIQTVTAAAKRATARADVRYRFICDCISTSYASDRTPSSASCKISIVSKNASILNCGWYPQQVFTGFVPALSVGVVGGEKLLESLAGNPVTVTGRIELYKGRPEIVISSPAQIVKE